MEAAVGRELRSLRRTIAGLIALTACAGCSSLTGLGGSQTPPAQPAAGAAAGTAAPPAAASAAAQAPASAQAAVTPPPAPAAQAAATPPPPPPAAAPPAAAPASTGSASFTSRVKSWFVGDPGQTLQTSPTATSASVDFNCPGIDYRQGAATLTVNDNKSDNSALNLKYQASFVKTARECDVHGENVTMRVGVQGRVVVGPAGGPGTVTVPLRYALVKEGIEPQVLWTKLFVLNVAVPSTQLNVPFTHVEEEMTIPIPPPNELSAYVIYIGFDPDGLKPAEKPKPVARPKSARAK
jgi:hypothetical protein